MRRLESSTASNKPSLSKARSCVVLTAMATEQKPPQAAALANGVNLNRAQYLSPRDINCFPVQPKTRTRTQSPLAIHKENRIPSSTPPAQRINEEYLAPLFESRSSLLSPGPAKILSQRSPRASKPPGPEASPHSLSCPPISTHALSKHSEAVSFG